MTIVKIQEETTFGGNGNRKYVKKKLLLKCDECNNEFICSENSKSRSIRQENHFCSKQCAVKSLTNSVLKDKSKNTFVTKYGTENYMQTTEFKNRIEKLCLQQYGVKSRLEAPEILDKIKNTCLEKYGRETFAGSPEWENKLNRIEIANKAWITKLSKEDFKFSKPEEKMYLILCKYFGEENVKRQIKLGKNWIDFYVDSISTYVSVDGVYWHGLDRSIELIKEGRTMQDKSIYKHYLSDRKLDEYCKYHNVKLVRITDEDMLKYSDEKIVKIVKGM